MPGIDDEDAGPDPHWGADRRMHLEGHPAPRHKFTFGSPDLRAPLRIAIEVGQHGPYVGRRAVNVDRGGDRPPASGTQPTRHRRPRGPAHRGLAALTYLAKR